MDAIAEGPPGLGLTVIEEFRYSEARQHARPFRVGVRFKHYRGRQPPDYPHGKLVVEIDDANGVHIMNAYCSAKSEATIQRAEQFLLDLCNVRYP